MRSSKQGTQRHSGDNWRCKLSLMSLLLTTWHECTSSILCYFCTCDKMIASVTWPVHLCHVLSAEMIRANMLCSQSVVYRMSVNKIIKWLFSASLTDTMYTTAARLTTDHFTVELTSAQDECCNILDLYTVYCLTTSRNTEIMLSLIVSLLSAAKCFPIYKKITRKMV